MSFDSHAGAGRLDDTAWLRRSRQSGPSMSSHTVFACSLVFRPSHPWLTTTSSIGMRALAVTQDFTVSLASGSPGDRGSNAHASACSSEWLGQAVRTAARAADSPGNAVPSRRTRQRPGPVRDRRTGPLTETNQCKRYLHVRLSDA